MTELERLRAWLKNVPPGPITDTADLERLLGGCWHLLMGSEAGGMEGGKLRGRMKEVSWNPPRLYFTVERHGGTVLGSTRAELQGWIVDVASGSATCGAVGQHQLNRMQSPLKVEPIAEEIVRLIKARQKDDRLKWHDDGRVRVLIGVILPKGSAVKQTLEGRRRRFTKALKERLNAEGWREVVGALHTYEEAQ